MNFAPAYQWNARDVDASLDLPNFNLLLVNFNTTDKVYIRVDAPNRAYYTYVLDWSDILALGIAYKAQIIELNIDPEMIDMIEIHEGAVTGTGRPISRCPLNSTRTCWGTTLGTNWHALGFSKPSDAIGEWTISVWIESDGGNKSNIVSGKYNVVSTLIGEK